jgi:hypothetical protein
VPETAGRSLEQMHRLFELPWYKIGLYGNEDAEHLDAAYEQKTEEAGVSMTAHVEQRRITEVA